MKKIKLPVKTTDTITLVAEKRNQRLYVTEHKDTIGLAIEHSRGTTSINLTLEDANNLQDVLRAHIIELDVKQQLKTN